MRLAVSTRPLTDRDRDLALLARADAAFSALPSDAVVLVVGSDPLEAKYGTSWDGTTVLPGPAFGLGAERVLPGGVRFRRGDVPQSMVQIAAYAGPEAPANRLREAEAVAAGIRVVSADGPPSSVPASGSGPSGTSPVAAQGLREVARAGSGGSSLVLEAGADCAYVRPAGSQPQLPGHDRLGGGCGARPTGGGIAPIGSVALVWGDPGTPPASASVMRVGSNVRTVSARTADGRTFAAVLGADGWGVAVGPGRIVGLTAVDAAGRQVEAFVP